MALTDTQGLMAMSVIKGWKELVELGATFVLVRVKDSQGCDLARTLKVPTGDFFQGASAFVKADSSSVFPRISLSTS